LLNILSGLIIIGIDIASISFYIKYKLVKLGVMKTIFEYDYYRTFLNDYYQEKKKNSTHFSHRFIAQKVGLKSTGHFALIIQGKANISITLIEHFSRFLGLKKKEADYFQSLVLYNQAKTHQDKKLYLEKMLSLKESEVKVLDAKQYEFYAKWYYTAVREVLAVYKFNGENFTELGKMIEPAISPAEAKKSIELLDQLGLIKKDPQGFYEQTDAVISTGYNHKSVSVDNFVINGMDLAREALDRFPKDERNMSWMACSVSPEGYGKILDELRSFRRRALEIAREDQKADRAYQFNFQVFPISKKNNKDKL
jgi:uncharacterized protein (TIGR02147 family)